MHDVLIIGGGVIGLSLAWELAQREWSVQVIDQSEPGREASWAGAGILPPAVLNPAQHPSDQLRGLACELHPQWAQRLHSLTGIDTGYRRCGGLYLARTIGEGAALAAWAGSLHDDGIEAVTVGSADVRELEPGLKFGQSGAVLLPGEAQLRNPRHLKALLAACEKTGVTVTSNVSAADFVVRDNQLAEVNSSIGSLAARHFCFTAGAWTGQILAHLGIKTGILPIRGQMVLFNCDSTGGRPISRVVNEGSRYIVPRDDGRVLAGSTEEEVGFDKRTTDDAIFELTEFARGLVPALSDARIERTWAGLRPGSFDGLPYLGRLPDLRNAFVAAGHFRTGLYLSPATAVVMSQFIRGEEPQIDLSAFRVGR
jgi:glycine oxidase